ncbi:MAG TPA: GntR family transcriptional regulator [Roseiflexaceae bacterium]|jgi:DNA-binding LacI/PurR family transcriptional regulator|nr:GntR family transcriptional regulator [Roseiflexaceae bacterium]
MTRYAQLRTYFRERILDGSLPPGAQLPTEFEIARQHHVSRGTVRHALESLVHEGLLERTQGRGTFVRKMIVPPPQPEAVERRLGLLLNRHGGQLDLDILVGVDHAAKSRGYQVSFAYAEDNVEQQDRDIARLLDDRVAGLIIFPVNNTTYNASIWRLNDQGVPFVLVDRYFPELESDYVVCDNVGGAYRAVEHLLILGHKRIAFVYSDSDGLQTTSVRDRWQGYRNALADYELPYDDSLVIQKPSPTKTTTDSPYMHFLSQRDRPSAVFAVNDHEALALLRTAQQCDLRVPEDLALVGFDDLHFAQHLHPPLTTVAQPRLEIGLRAGNLLINRVEGQNGPARHIELPTSLVVRESCGARLRVRAVVQQASP